MILLLHETQDYHNLFLLLHCILLWAQASAHFGAAKYVPADGQRLLILGQDLGAVGGLDSHSDGYVDNLNHIPAGVTTYTSIPSLSGLLGYANWGAGDVNAQAYLDDATFDNSCIAIGLFINGELRNIRDGFWNNKIRTLAQWIKDADRPVFLRIGYEFDGPWNGLDPEDYVEAWKQIVKVFDWEEVRNVAYVWQSAGINTNNIDRWYPGDEYVNWVGYSHFEGQNIGQSIRQFAAAHDKPIMIAEATPRRNLKTGAGPAEWNNWFEPLFASIDNNEQIKALAYINANWDEQPMWTGQGWGDSRIQENDYIRDQWLNEIGDGSWLLSSNELLDQLQYTYWQEKVPLGSEVIHQHEVQINEVGDQIIVSSTATAFEAVLYDLSGSRIMDGSSNQGQLMIDKSLFKQRIIVARVIMDDQVMTRKILLTH